MNWKRSVFTFSISPQFNINRDAMVYARIASGYRPGGPNVALPGFPSTVDSETVTSYEAGVKASFLDRMVSLDAAVFLLDWNDLQIGQAFANGINGLVNAGTAQSKGFEAALTVLPATGAHAGRELRLRRRGMHSNDAQLHRRRPASEHSEGERRSNRQLRLPVERHGRRSCRRCFQICRRSHLGR